MNTLKNFFINRTLHNILDGNKGSNLLTVLIAAIVGANLDYMKAVNGFKFENQADVIEASKLVGLIVVTVWGYFIGKRKAKTEIK